MPARAQQHGGLRFYRAPRQPEQNSTAGFVFTERARRQPEGKTARRRALLRGATSMGPSTAKSTAARRRALLQSGHGATPTAISQQHGGVRFCRSSHGSQGTAARRRALLSGATLARATQHGGVCFHRARASSARGHNSTAVCASTWRHVNSQSEHSSAPDPTWGSAPNPRKILKILKADEARCLQRSSKAHYYYSSKAH
jgi:hypothetical protein